VHHFFILGTFSLCFVVHFSDLVPCCFAIQTAVLVLCGKKHNAYVEYSSFGIYHQSNFLPLEELKTIQEKWHNPSENKHTYFY